MLRSASEALQIALVFVDEALGHLRLDRSHSDTLCVLMIMEISMLHSPQQWVHLCV